MTYDIETFSDQRQRESIVQELLNSVVKTGSNLLDETQQFSWMDLNFEDQMRVATSLLTGLEDNAFLLADTIAAERNVVHKVKNICKTELFCLSKRIIEQIVEPFYLTNLYSAICACTRNAKYFRQSNISGSKY